jgi:elongation factor P hydroxylase
VCAYQLSYIGTIQFLILLSMTFNHQRDHDSSVLIQLFNQLFEQSENTILVGGGNEPIYLPAEASASSKNRIIFRLDYFASALHEVAHWCLAGSKRRQLEDYGYWYFPDGRDQHWQARFEEVEIRPQAIECLFSQAAQFPFQVSQDNLMNTPSENQNFNQKVQQQAELFYQSGMPARAELFYQALKSYFIVSVKAIW